jgi:hypothetical protein
MMRIEDGQPAGPPVEPVAECVLCNAPVDSQTALYVSHPASSTESRVARLNAASREWALGMVRLPRRAAGSSSTTTGSTRSRGWSGTGSSVSVCRRLKQRRSGATSTPDRSTAGTGTGKTLASLKLSSKVDASTGTAAPTLVELREMSLEKFEEILRRNPKWGVTSTPADRCAEGLHVWGWVTYDDENWFCIHCHKRWTGWNT